MAERSLIYTQHALVRMHQRGIRRSDVEKLFETGRVTTDPSFTPIDPVYRIHGSIKRTHQRARIVFRYEGETIVVITAMFLTGS